MKVNGFVLKKNGFTLIELIIAMVVAGIMAAISIPIYNGLTHAGAASAITGNISKLKTACQEYAGMNGGSYSGLSAAALQADGLLPGGWATSGNIATPPNGGIVNSYSISSADTWYGADGSFDIAVTGDITDAMAYSICMNFENNITAFQWKTTPYQVTTGGTDCGNITQGSTVETSPQIDLAF